MSSSFLFSTILPKPVRTVLLVLLTVSSASVVHADWQTLTNTTGEPSFGGTERKAQLIVPTSGITASAFSLSSSAQPAETSSPEIAALARGLLNSPERIYEFVLNNIAYEHYFCSKKGARLTLLEGSGNDYDQCALLIALLNEAATNTGAAWTVNYQLDDQVVPYGDGTGNDFVSWVGSAPALVSYAQLWQNFGFTSDPLSTLTSWSDDAKAKYFYAYEYSFQRGWPASLMGFQTGTTNFFLTRMLVKFVRGGTVYLLDPSFKRSVRSTPTALGTALGYNQANFLASVTPTTPANAYTAKGISESGIQTTLSQYANNLRTNLQGSATPNISVDDFLGRMKIVPQAITSLPTTTPLTTLLVRQDNISPTMDNGSRMALTFEIGKGKAYDVSTTIFASDLAGQRLSLTFSGTNMYLWLEDKKILTATNVSDASVELDTTFAFPTLSADTRTSYYTKNDSYAYALYYGFMPNGLQLRQRQRILDGFLGSAKALAGVTYDSAGNLNLSSISDATLKRQCITETLNVMGLTFAYDTCLSNRLVGTQFQTDMFFHYQLGRLGQEDRYYVDAFQNAPGFFSSSGSADVPNAGQVAAFFSSAFEHGIIEQLQPSAGALSTVKVLAMANDSTTASLNTVYRADATSWPSIKPLLNFGNFPLDLQSALLDYYIGQGYVFLIPSGGASYTLGSWTGCGYAKVSNSSIVMGIEQNGPTIIFLLGGANGQTGVVTSKTGTNAQTAPAASVTSGSATQPLSSSPTPNAIALHSKEPVDMSTGAYLVENEDLSLGEGEPRGLHLVREYNSNSTNFDPTGLGWGWTHSYNIVANVRSAPEVGISEGTPYDMAAYLAAVYTTVDLLKHPTTYLARDWTVTALVANWAVNNLNNNAVAITLGKDSWQFIRQPDGSYQPPAMSTLSLTKDGSGNYSLTERFGRTFFFAATNALRCTSITDFDGKAMTLTYDSAHAYRLTKVTDASSRSITFNYTGTRLSSVTDNNSPARTVTYLAADGNGNLTGCTDPEGQTWSYSYTNRLIIQTSNPDSAVIINNTYDAQNRVATQLNQGLSARTWNYFWSGVRNVEQSPLAQQTTYFYDRRGRSLGIMDGDGNRSRLAYDGQDHVVQAITPKGEATGFAYDANQNLTVITDPLGATVTNTYDSSQRLTQIAQVDSAATVPTRTSTLVYNAGNVTNRPDSTSDPRGVTTQYTYETTSAAAGKPTTVKLASADGNRTATCYYDSYGLLKELDTPNPAGGVFSELYTFNFLGDLQSFTDKNGNAFGFQYNKRRQKISDTGPGDGYTGNPDYTSAITQYVYSNEGDLQYLVDPLGHTIKNIWSATGKLISTQAGLQQTAPNTYDATNAITTVTNNYDVSDWLTSSVGPVNSQALDFTYYNSGRVLSLTDPNSYVTTFSYDANGQPVTATDSPDGSTSRSVSQTYNARGQSDSATDALGNQTLFTYNAWGDQLSLKNRLGNTYTFAYENNGLPNAQTTPLGFATGLAYNDRNLLKTLTKPSAQQTTYSYDAADRVSSLTEKQGATQLGSVSFGYDANTNATTVTEGGTTITRTFDPYNRVKSYTDSRGNVIQYHYYANGLLKSVTYPYPANRTVTYTYDSLNRPYQVTDWAGNVTTFTWRADGLLSMITRPNNSTRSLTYDNAGHLKRIEERDLAGMLHTLLNYQLDPAGRIKAKMQIPLPVAPSPALAAMTYDADNRLATFGGTPGTCAFDSDGNMTYGPLGNATDGTAGFGTYTFDQRNRLTANPGQTRSYDAENNLLSRTDASGTTYHVYSGGAMAQLLTREPPSGTKYYYVYGAGQLLYEISEGGPAPTGLINYHFDHNGNTIALSNNAGQIVQRNEYSPYGQLTQTSANYDTPFLFAGALGVQTSGDGLLYMRARFMNPRMGRFLNTDPIGFGGGSNFYAYCGNNPVSLSDPFGLCPGSSASQSVWDQIVANNRATLKRADAEVSDMMNGGAEGIVNLTIKPIALSAVSGIENGKAVRQTSRQGDYSLATLYGLAMIGDVGNVALSLIPGEGAEIQALEDAVRFHHPWPMYLGGKTQQILEALPKAIHDAYHSGLDKILARQKGAAYYAALSPAARAEALQDLAAYTKAFDAKYGTKLYDAMVREGFPH